MRKFLFLISFWFFSVSTHVHLNAVTFILCKYYAQVQQISLTCVEMALANSETRFETFSLAAECKIWFAYAMEELWHCFSKRH
jgi:hypothetical protein